jgi:signal transduction histidine kinase
VKRPRARRITLRARLTLIYGGLFLVAGVVLLGATYALFNQQLSRSAQKVVAQIDRHSNGEEVEQRLRVQTGTGETLTLPEAQEWMLDQQRQVRDAATTSLLTQGAIALVVVGGAAAGFGWLVAGRVLAPLHQVTDTARRISMAPAADRGLHERIALHGPDDEVKDLADTFDTMVERLDRSFDGQRRFVANASHELRTPLTLGRSLVEMAMHRKSASEDVKRLGEHLLEINSRHERLIAGLLVLARSENEMTERFPVDLADVVTHVVSQFDHPVELSAAEAYTSGDALLLERMVHNLVENAVRYNEPEGWVSVSSRTRGDRVEVSVGNTGPAIPPYEVPTLFEPFRRLSDRLGSTKGAGLGLSIVRSVARAHGGDATATARTGGGLVVTVTLPVVQPIGVISS